MRLMPPEILALIDKPLSLIAVLFVGALFGMMIEQVVSRQRPSIRHFDKLSAYSG